MGKKWQFYTTLALGILGMAMMMQHCGKQKVELPKILTFNGDPVYMDELELLGRMAVTKSNLKFDTEEGQARYKEIAPNLYNTLIDIYVIKEAAKRQGVSADPEQTEAQYKDFVQTLKDQNGYERFMMGLGLNEERLRELIADMLAMNILQDQKLNEGKEDPSEEEIKSYYYQNHQLFRYPSRLRASHIFFDAKEDATAAQHNRAKERAEQILQLMNDDPAKNFVKLAQSYSEDPGNAPRGGDLGFITRDALIYPENFKEVAWSLSVGDMSGIIQTSIGYHIIWVTDHEQSLEEAVPQIKQNLIEQKMAENYQTWKSQLRKEMDIQRYFNPYTFELLNEPVPDDIEWIPNQSAEIQP
jgi:parvulin-like peptidyl-prolyl isomerase